MDLRDVFTASAIILVGVIAAGSWIGFLNASYGTTAGSSFNATIANVQTTLGGNLSSVSISSGNNTVPPSGAGLGAGTTTQQQGLITRSLSTLQQAGAFFSLIPSVISDGARIVGIPDTYATIAAWVFIFALAVTIGLMLLQIARGSF